MMGAGDWVAGGLRRAASGVRSAVQGSPDQPAESASAPAGEPAELVVDVPAAPAKEAPAKKAPAKKAPAKKAPATRAPAKRAPATKASAGKAPAKRAPATKATATKAPTKKAPAKPAAVAEPPAAASPSSSLPEWSDEELAAFRAALEADVIRLREELNMGRADMEDLLSDSGDGAGDDQADAGSKTLEREQEMSVNANALDLLEQSEHALVRLDEGTYGICESCGTAIPAARLKAFPRATLCIPCKQSEERR